MVRNKLFIDLGHSVKYPGADGVKSEVVWNRSIYPYLIEELDQSFWEVVLVPDSFPLDLSANGNLINRIKWINARSTAKDFLISLHGNAASRSDVRGVTTCYMGGSDFARLEAIKLSASYSKETNVPVWQTGEFADTRSRYGQLGMVRETKPFALLIEAGFVTNADDMAINPVAAARGIANYYNAYNPNFRPMASNDQIQDEGTIALDTLDQLNIMNDKSNPDRPMTRREFAIAQYRTIAYIHQLIKS